MKSGWILNIVMLLVIVGIVAFLHFRPQQKQATEQEFEVSTLKMGSFSKVSVEFPAKAAINFDKVDGNWRITQPFDQRADQAQVQRIISIIAATSKEKFPVTDLARFGLDSPKLKLKLDNEEFLFGTYNPLTSDQYVAYKDAVYLLSGAYSESASSPVDEYIDKNILRPTEKIAGFDLSRLEQWEDIRLNVDLVNGQWKASAAKAKPEQNSMNEWFDTYWKQSPVKSVERYTPDRKATYPALEIKLEGGKTVHLDKMQESPELLLARPDEGIIYHIAQDAGFVMVNPPINLGK